MNEIFKRQKKEILDWIENLENEDVIKKLLEIKYDVETSVYEAKAEYAVKDNFEERWAEGLTPSQARDETKRRIREWWGK